MRVVDHAHVAIAAAVLAIGFLGFLFGMVRKILLVVALFVVVTVGGLVTLIVAAHGTHCAPGSQQRVCLDISR